MNKSQLVDMFQCIREEIESVKEELGNLDAKLGDGDLGITMTNGFSVLPDYIAGETEENIGKLISKAGMKFSSTAPSTMGFLMGTGLMYAGKMLGDKTLDGNTYGEFLQGLIAGVEKRGKCSAGGRTILDALLPAKEAVLTAQNGGMTEFRDLAKEAEKGALNGVEATKNMIPKYGKAAVHKAAAAGEPDQGALAAYHVIVGIKKFAEKEV